MTQATVFALDTIEPTLRLLSRSPRVRMRLSEAADVVVVADGVRTLVRKSGPGVVVLPVAASDRACGRVRPGREQEPRPARRLTYRQAS